MNRIPSPGEYVLLSRAARPNWPAMICTDDMAPSGLRRPNGYLTLVLIIEESPNFYYAPSGDVHEFEPIGEHPDRELQAAHSRVLEAMDWSVDRSRSSLEYWKLKTEHQSGLSAPKLTTSPNSSYVPEQGSDDDEVEIAISLSLRELHKGKKSVRVTPPPPSPRIFKRAGGAADLRTHFRPIEKQGTALSSELGPRRYEPSKMDYIDGDLSASRYMVKVFVGELDDEFLIPKSEVEKLPFLSDPQIGCMSTMEDGTPRLDLICLRDFDPAHFGFVAEFLSTGRFGHSIVDEENRETVLEECADAWPIADRIVLEDMLDYIVTKVQQAQLRVWEEAWFLALMVYKTSGTPLNAYKLMKELLVEAIAANFLEKVGEHASEHGNVIVDRLRDVPELERDIYRRLLQTAEQRVGEN